MLWVYVVVEFNNPTFLLTVLWPFSSTPIVTTLWVRYGYLLHPHFPKISFVRTSLPIQIYLAWRIQKFSDSTIVFLYLVLLSVAQASLGFACSIKAFGVPEWASNWRCARKKKLTLGKDWFLSHTHSLCGRLASCCCRCRWEYHVGPTWNAGYRPCSTYLIIFSAMLWWYLSKSRTGRRSKCSIPVFQYAQCLDVGTIYRKWQCHR